MTLSAETIDRIDELRKYTKNIYVGCDLMNEQFVLKIDGNKQTYMFEDSMVSWIEHKIDEYKKKEEITALQEKMNTFQNYKRTNIASMRRVIPSEIMGGVKLLQSRGISISQADIDAGSPKQGDMIARNPDNHNDMWLVAADYFEKNFEPA